MPHRGILGRDSLALGGDKCRLQVTIYLWDTIVYPRSSAVRFQYESGHGVWDQALWDSAGWSSSTTKTFSNLIDRMRAPISFSDFLDKLGNTRTLSLDIIQNRMTHGSRTGFSDLLTRLSMIQLTSLQRGVWDSTAWDECSWDLDYSTVYNDLKKKLQQPG